MPSWVWGIVRSRRELSGEQGPWLTTVVWFIAKKTGKKFTHAYEGSRSPLACALHWNPPGFCKKRSSTFLTNLVKWKSDESTKHYLTQMLLAINWRYWQTLKNSRMQMKVKGRLMQARFIEIHQVFVKKKKKVGTFLTDRIFELFPKLIWNLFYWNWTWTHF